jgi:hypothetical protein
MRIVLLSLLAIGLLAQPGCKQLGEKLNVKGNITGRVLNADGSPRGYVSVALMDEAGAEVQRQTAEDSGNFFFSGVPGGTFTVKVFAGADKELPVEPLTVKLGLGKTKQIEVQLKPEEQQQP